MNESKYDTVHGETTDTPKAFLETLTFAAAITGTKLVYDVSKDAYVSLKPDKPLNVVVEDSNSVRIKEEDDEEEQEDGSDLGIQKHVIQAEIVNLGEHSVYINSLEVLEPKNIELEVGCSNKCNQTEYKFNHSKEEDLKYDFLPIRMFSEERIRVRLYLEYFDEKRLKKKPFTKIKINYLVLGLGKEPKDFSFNAAIRF